MTNWLRDETGKLYSPRTLFELAMDDLADSERHGARGRYRLSHLQELFRKGEISLIDIGWKL